MKRTSCVLFNIVALTLIPAMAGAAGTYYNGLGYQKNNADFYNKYSNSRGNNYANMYKNGYAKTTTSRKVTKKTTKKSESQEKTASAKSGFVVGGALSHEFANWDFEMNSAGSKLKYDNLAWNVISGEGTYYFGDSTPMQIKVGARYGKQFGETSMVDDDITAGGYEVMGFTGTPDSSGNAPLVAIRTGHALSIGSSKDGTQMGFNASFGLTDAFSWGKVKFTPSVGYRYLKYEVSTKKNYGVAIDILESTADYGHITCISGYKGEIQCDPFLVFYPSGLISGRDPVDTNGNGVIDDEDGFSPIIVPAGSTQVEPDGTYYYEQSGTSHKYETEWKGPYVALDMEYVINKDNLVTGGIELGLPIYHSVGDQPYRYDWKHPKSVEDKGNFGDAYHFGLNANWATAINDSTSFTLGVTYDYYTVSKATAKTYLNSSNYEAIYAKDYEMLQDTSLTEYQTALLEEEMKTIDEYRASGWVVEDKKEIKSIYKAMGIRAGISVKF